LYDARIQTGELDTSKEEVLFNDSDIEDDSAVGEAVEVEQASEMKALLAGTSQDDSVFILALCCIANSLSAIAGDVSHLLAIMAGSRLLPRWRRR
jgi:hypothetical protein